MRIRRSQGPGPVYFIDICRPYFAKAIRGAAGLIFFGLLSLATPGLALPQNPENYDLVPGGLADIQNGAYVEGSLRTGGIQPDYYVDTHVEPLRSLMKRAEAIGRSDLDFWDKIGTVVELVNDDFFQYHDYYNPYYRRLLKKFRTLQKDIPLSEYGVCKAGVCRENALVLHFALKAAGIPNRHAYAEIYRSSPSEGWEITEDHAFTVVNRNGVDWVVDSYYWGFNGFRLEDLMTPRSLKRSWPRAPFASPAVGMRRILKIHDFPKIYNPKWPVRSCSEVYL